jgi:quinoprotein glucose dehydrogenase
MVGSRLAVLAVAGEMVALPAPAKAQTTKTSLPDRSHSKWNDYAGASDSAQYSALEQINRLTVGKLRVAWSYPTGDGKKYLFNPIVVDRTMYVLAHNHSIVALDATSGKQVWIHPTDLKTSLITNRGINYWESADRSDRRLIFAVDNFLQEIDARTGQSISDFGEGGRVDLREGWDAIRTV